MQRSILSALRARTTTASQSARRWLSSHKPDPPRTSPTSLDEQAAVRSRFARFVDRTPRFLRPTLTGLGRAPVSHVAAFIILHEVTAIVPLFGLAGAFHYWHWLPPYFAEGAWISEGVERFGRYFRRKGWITESDEREVEEQTRQGNAEGIETQTSTSANSSATRWVVEFATAYAVVKVLLPLRIVVSVWASPWFARLAVIPIGNVASSLFRRRKG